jgi:methyl-accepting chemotaxis protein
MGINEEIAKAFGAHGLWKTRIQQAIDSGTCEHSPDVVCRDDRCAFGKWLYSDGLPASVKTSSDYKAVRGLHADFHRAAGETLTKALAGDKINAQKDLTEGSFARAAERLSAAMVAWQRNAATECSGYISGGWRALCFFWKGRIALRIWAGVGIPSAAATLCVGYIDWRQWQTAREMNEIREIAAAAASTQDPAALHRALNTVAASAQAFTDSSFQGVLAYNIGMLLASLAGVAIVSVLTLGLTSPIRQLSRAMRRLINGQVTDEIPAIARPDEIGEMARAVLVFQQQGQMVEQMACEREQQRELAEGERRKSLITMADNIEGQTSSVVAHVAAETLRLLDTAERMAAGAKRVEENSQQVASAAEQSLSNAQAVAGAAEELSASIREIATQVSRSKAKVGQAVAAADDASATVEKLTESMAAIDQVVQVIVRIAAQTNMLALNATIEAARAGETGKGFAVVANEVKLLATRTGQEADDITRRIGQLNDMAQQVTTAIGGTVASIQEVEEIATAVAIAVEEQDAATNEIARNINEAARAAHEVSERIGDVASEAGRTGQQALVMEEMMDAMADKVTELGHVLTQVVRSTAPEVDRRAAPRIPMEARVRIACGHGEFDADLRDISVGGARVTGMAHGNVGETGTLKVDGISVPIVVVGRDNDMVRFRVEEQAVPLVERLMHRRNQKMAA